MRSHEDTRRICGSEGEGAETDCGQGELRASEDCITPPPEITNKKEAAGGTLAEWPARLKVVPPRIASGSIPGLTAESFRDDTLLWNKRVNYNKTSLITRRKCTEWYTAQYTLLCTVHEQHMYHLAHFLPVQDRYRSIMDMNALLGSFAAALVKDPVW